MLSTNYLYFTYILYLNPQHSVFFLYTFLSYDNSYTNSNIQLAYFWCKKICIIHANESKSWLKGKVNIHL